MDDFWVGTGAAPTNSPYYPFTKLIAAPTLAGAEQLPYELTRYLTDPPAPGYSPPSSNQYPRARLKKLIYWDTPLPLEQPLPTAEQMQSIQFNPESPDDPPDAQRGYRIYHQKFVQIAQTNAQTILRLHLGDTRRVETRNGFLFRQYIIYTVMVNFGLESNTGMTAASRSWDIVQAIIEATEGVNFGGIGGMVTDRINEFDDGRTNVGYRIYQYTDWNGEAPNPHFP